MHGLTYTFVELFIVKAIVSFGTVHSPEIAERLYKFLCSFCKLQKSM